MIHRVLENPRTGLVHARLIAAHHRNPVGLEAVAARPAFLNDREVQRLLLRNIQSSEALVRRLLASRRLPQIYECCQSHELPERHRQTARSILKVRFTAASPEERVDLILTTEGRVLGTLSGLALDGRSVALICGRGVRSTLLAENLGCWPATPPPCRLLLKHPLVRQAPALKLLLEPAPQLSPVGVLRLVLPASQGPPLLGPRRDRAQVVDEVEDEHDLVLDDAALVRGRGRRDPLAVRMEIVRGIRGATALNARRRPDLRRVGAERIADDGVRRDHDLALRVRNSSSCAVADHRG